MNAIGKIGVIIPAVTNSRNTDLLQEIYLQAEKLNYDVLVFTNSSNSETEIQQNNFAEGEENIYRLVSIAKLDGVIFVSGRFRNSTLINNIQYELKQLSIPSLILENQNSERKINYLKGNKSGENAVLNLHEMISKQKNRIQMDKIIRIEYNLISDADLMTIQQNPINNKLSPCKDSFYFSSNYIIDIAEADSISELICTASKSEFLSPFFNQRYICLCEDWAADFESSENSSESAYSENMVLYLPKRFSENDTEQYIFPTEELLPELCKPHMPILAIFTPLHNGRQTFGYCANLCRSERNFYINDNYINWCNAVSNGLLTLYNKIKINALQSKIQYNSVHDLSSGMYNKKGFAEMLPVFMNQDSPNEKIHFLLLISCKRIPLSQPENSFDVGMIMANAIQLSCGFSELAARISDCTFVLLIESNQTNDSAVLINERILYLEQIIKNIQDNTTSSHVIELVTDYCIIKNECEINALLDSRLQVLSAKIKISQQSDSDYAGQLYSLRREIRLSPQLDWKVTAFAKKLGISNSHFQRLYKQHFNICCMDDIINARIDKAKHLLNNSNLRIQEISEQCGYQNSSHFMRQFKNRVGISASQYRKQN